MRHFLGKDVTLEEASKSLHTESLAEEYDKFLKTGRLLPPAFEPSSPMEVATKKKCECWHNPETGQHEYCHEHMPYPSAHIATCEKRFTTNGYEFVKKLISRAEASEARESALRELVEDYRKSHGPADDRCGLCKRAESILSREGKS